MARWILANGLCPDRVLTSSAVRARETAQHVADTCGLTPDAVDTDDDLYIAGFRQWLGRLRAEPHSTHRLLICGHNPSLDLLVETLSATTPPLSQNGKLMTTAAVAHLSCDRTWGELLPASCTLHRLQRPREL